ncbi:DUF4861 family protein [Winogradskyella litoriviva]|uniref:DUF4861 family protein n=1 Tax=Winogradskyella litoriviva TaxID=1220182 RepID=A0ABX2E482_9FLAO|nr:DUF4861 family protein [Winogradskyella litoriviva]NRD23087.1 DUF4861 family protein [Winogradskyella litoriviva]
MNITKISFLVIVSLLLSCSTDKENTIITIKNSLEFARTFETVELTKSDLNLENLTNVGIRNMESKKLEITQIIDSNNDGDFDVILFQPKIKANAVAKYEVVLISEAEKTKSQEFCYSRFVPERTDDYAWENNRVAFRTFGPTAQKMIEDGVKGGTLTSGMDAWLKRVEYPIINKWYAKADKEKGAYHKDTGEGLDNFHVGVSRGVGGIAVKTDSNYAVSKNFTAWKTITNGPIRTSFILDYENWDANGKEIKERKHISLDYGQNLSRHIVEITGTDKVSIGLTLHKNDGEVTTNKAEAWMSYWEPFDDSELGQGVVLNDKTGLVAFDNYVTDKKDQSNLYVQSDVSEKIEYYAGFGWKKSGQFQSKEEWNNYLSRFSTCLDNPLEVKVKIPLK